MGIALKPLVSKKPIGDLTMLEDKCSIEKTKSVQRNKKNNDVQSTLSCFWLASAEFNSRPSFFSAMAAKLYFCNISTKRVKKASVGCSLCHLNF